MKALDKIKDMIDFCDAVGCHRALYESLKAVELELEALQQSKQCNTCNFYHSFTGVCANDKCPLCTDFVDADFGCIYHEAKGAMR